MNQAATKSADEAATIAYGARTSILSMAWAGLIGYTSLTAILLIYLFSPAEESRGFILYGGLYGAYGMWVFSKLLRCGQKLSPTGENLAEALELHHQFWFHAPFVSALTGLTLLAAIFYPGIQRN